MNTEPDLATQPTVRLPVPSPEQDTAPGDPLAKVMLTPRTFTVVLVVAAALLGLLLALLPVRVADGDVTGPSTFATCGNTIGGVETGPLARDLDNPEPDVLATYVSTCESAIAVRQAWSWPMFFAGVLAIVWFGVVRKPVDTAHRPEDPVRRPEYPV